MKNAAFWDVTLCVRTDVEEDRVAPIIRVTRIGELRTMLAVSSKRRALPDYRVATQLVGSLAVFP
jgi:hypothetical protein